MLSCEQVKEKIKNISINEVVISGGTKDCEYKKIRIKRLEGKKGVFYQIEKHTENKVFHENTEQEKILDKIFENMYLGFKQCDISGDFNVLILMNRKREFTIASYKENKNFTLKTQKHNKEKNYILSDTENIPWLKELGVTDEKGKVLAPKQKKFRQINKFLEMLSDVEEYVSENSVIIDMGCGKSYLTFAIYHYFNIIKHKNVCIKGYDLKEDVVENCNRLAEKFGFKDLKFYCEDVANIQRGKEDISMTISLHACDTATDYAIYHAMRWGCKVIMNVPCCQHEINKQIDKKAFPLMLSNGITKERFSALLTDSVRARILTLCGYEAVITEFIETEHTPKNIMIRSVKKDKAPEKKADLKSELENTLKHYNISQTLWELVKNDTIFEKNIDKF